MDFLKAYVLPIAIFIFFNGIIIGKDFHYDLFYMEIESVNIFLIFIFSMYGEESKTMNRILKLGFRYFYLVLTLIVFGIKYVYFNII